MMRSNRPSAATAARKSRARTPCEQLFARSARDVRPATAADGRFDRTIVQRLLNAAESTVRRHGG
eukprot:6315882-Lingulodinium_polyedra.AAC.1